MHRACILTDAGESKVEFRGPIDVREVRVSSRPLDAGCNRSCVFLTPLHLIADLIGRGSPFFPTSERHSQALLLLCGRAWTRVHVLSPSVLSLLSLSPLSLSIHPLVSRCVWNRRGGPFKRRRVSLCLWLSSCMSFNFIKLENRKYELTPSTSEPPG